MACRGYRFIRGCRNVFDQHRIDAIRNIALTVLRRIEHKEDNIFRRRVTLVLDDSAPRFSTIAALLTQKGVIVAPAEYEKQIDEQRTQLVFQARVPRTATEDFVAVLESQPGVKRVRVEPT